MLNSKRSAIAAAACALVMCTSAHADAGLTLKKLTWDPRQPDATPYQDVVLDNLMNAVINQAWGNARATMQDALLKEVTNSDRIRSGITLYNVDLRLSPGDPQVTVLPAGPTGGVLRLFLPRSEMTFTTTYPLTSRDTDPRFRLTWDLSIDVVFQLNGNRHPPIDIISAQAKSMGAKLDPVNVSGAVGLLLSEIEDALMHNGTLSDVVTQGMNRSSMDVTRLLTSSLRTNGRSLDIPAGYQYNGGRVDPGRIIVAAWQPKVLPKVDIPLQVSWDGKWGRLLPNCEPMSLRISLPYAPPPFGQAKHIDSDNFPGATPGSVQMGKDFGCSQTIAATHGVTGTLSYKEMVIDAGHPRTPGYDVTARAVPVSWSNPLLTGDATRGKAQFRLDVSEGMHDGSVQHDRAQEVLSRRPGDPVERNIAINPADRVTTATNPADRANATVNPAQRVIPGVTQAAKASPASRFAGTSRVADDLNPQPLPPGPPGPPDRSKAAAARATTTTTSSSNAPPSSLNAPASSLQGR
jgi:hypothetical protein